MDWTSIVFVAGFAMSLAGFVLVLIFAAQRAHAAARKPESRNPYLEGGGELWASILGSLGMAIVVGSNIVEGAQRGAARVHIIFALAAFAASILLIGVSLGALLERWKRRAGGGAVTAQGEAAQG